MEEKFREWDMNESIKVSYIDNTGEKQVWTINQKFLLMKIQNLIYEYLKQGIKMTNRQLYYQLVSAGLIPNADAIYRRINAFLTTSRYAGLIDWDAIEDRGRVPEIHAEWNSIKNLISSAVYSYRLPRWSEMELILAKKREVEELNKTLCREKSDKGNL